MGFGCVILKKKAAKCCKIIAEGLENLATAAISARKCHGYGLWVIFQFFGTFFLSRYLWYLQYFSMFLQYFVKKKYRTKNCGCNIFRHLEQTQQTQPAIQYIPRFRSLMAGTYHTLAWGLVWADPKGFLISIKFKAAPSHLSLFCPIHCASSQNRWDIFKSTFMRHLARFM